MRKRLLMMLAILFTFSIVAAACGSDSDGTSDEGGDTTTDTTADDTTDTTAEETTDTTADDAMAEETVDGTGTTVAVVFDIGGEGDQSFNDAAVVGIKKAEADLGITYTTASPNEDGSNRGELIQFGAENSDLTIGVGFEFGNIDTAIYTSNPDVSFAVVDNVIDSPNVAGLVFAEEQGSFLVGAAAALKSPTDTVGFIGGVSGVGGLIEKFEAGFVAGAKAVNPDINVVTTYITASPDFDGFNAPDQAREIALGMYEDGAGVIYHAAGGSGSGLFAAAKEASGNGDKVWAIGVDSDQYLTADADVQEYILTSMLKRVDTAVFEIVKSYVAGTFAGGPTAYDLSVDGVGYSTAGGFVDDITTELEDYKAQIVDGTIVVPTEP